MFVLFQQLILGIGQSVNLTFQHNNAPGIPGGSSTNWTSTDASIAGTPPFLKGLKVGQTLVHGVVTAPGMPPVDQYILVNVVAQNFQIVPVTP